MRRLALVALLLTACTQGRDHAAPVSGPPTTRPLEMDVVRHDFTPSPTTTTTAVTHRVTAATTAPPVRATVAEVEPLAAAPPVTHAPAVSSGSVWDDLADCESGNGVPGSGTANWHINTGNGYYGGLQFSLSSWRYVGGSGYPHEHSRAEQIHRAEKLRATPPGWGHWPACSRRMGLR